MRDLLRREERLPNFLFFRVKKVRFGGGKCGLCTVPALTPRTTKFSLSTTDAESA
jgi:hypothetical protein